MLATSADSDLAADVAAHTMASSSQTEVFFQNATQTTMTTLLLVDDHPLFGVGFAHALSSADLNFSVDAVLSEEEALLRAEATDYDIVLIDYRLGDGDRDGIEVLRRFAVSHPLLARVLISGDESPALMARARSAGASGFLGKSMPMEELVAALNLIAAGKEVFGGAKHGGLPPPHSLPTARQHEVLALVAKGLPNKLISSELGIAERTVKLHITALMDSLEARNRTHLIVMARARGLL